MAAKSTFDLIIAGAGASGLSLLRNILSSEKLKDLSILLLDLNLTPKNDKTWCFWDDSNLPDSHLIRHSWKSLEVRAYGNLFAEELRDYRYHCLRSVDYSTAILEMAEISPQVTLLEASIHDFSNSGESATVHTSKGDFTASWIFQSALKPPGFKNLWVDVSLKQHFLGAEVKTDKPVFDPETVVLMDFDTSQKHGVTFFYILPFSETEALVEYTFFTEHLLSQEEYMGGIEAYMKSRYGLRNGQYTITRTESGSIPMEDRRYPAWYIPRVMNIGTTGGLTKPSTGYTFTRIQQHSKAIAEALSNGQVPPVSNLSSYRFRVYDMMLLYLLEAEPATCKTIFHELFKRNRFDKILRFLEEDTTLGEEISIFASLPYLPFFKAIYKMKHRILTGA